MGGVWLCYVLQVGAFSGIRALCFPAGSITYRQDDTTSCCLMLSAHGLGAGEKKPA